MTRPAMPAVSPPVEVADCAARELTDAELEGVSAGKQLGGTGQGSNASRGWYGAAYGGERGYDSYGTHIG